VVVDKLGAAAAVIGRTLSLEGLLDAEQNVVADCVSQEGF